ncbi:LysR family transcriptional regulator [Nevskia soli]|uniref:LysR family transcriptional regulator n=1 Tax=Nevskia soli TaxID=418856 RepID=UPI00068B02A6|nr:LysR family transcriptional regulator [Nevskia soli]
MLDLNEVAMFVEVVRAGSFSATARQLNLPHNTVSRRIARLETYLGVRLMQRSTRKLTLTGEGRRFFERVESSLSNVFEAERELVNRADTPAGTLRVAAPADFMSVFQAGWLVEFLERYPQVRLDFVLDDLKTDLITSGIDVALRADPEKTPNFLYQRAMSRNSILVASPQYLERRGRPESVRELKGHECLTGSSRHNAVTWQLQGPKGVEEVAVSGPFRANNASSLMRACIAGLGIALLPEILISREVADGRLLVLLPQLRRKGEDYEFVFPSRRQIPVAASVFADFAGQKLRSLTNADATLEDKLSKHGDRPATSVPGAGKKRSSNG